MSWHLSSECDYSDTILVELELTRVEIRMNHCCAPNSIENASEHEPRATYIYIYIYIYIYMNEMTGARLIKKKIAI